MGRTAGTIARASQLIDSVKRQLSGATDVIFQEGGPSEDINVLRSFDDLHTSRSLGQGGFGRVVKGQWRDLTVAVKRMTLPSKLSKSDRRQMMALMELAISSTLLHPNIVKTHSYTIRPIRDPLPAAVTEAAEEAAEAATATFVDPRGKGPSSGGSAVMSPFHSRSFSLQPPTAFEIQIIMEFCDIGTLRDAFGRFSKISAQNFNYKAILHTAIEIAKGMQHLHSCRIIHADLKPLNILLVSAPQTPKGFIAKIADFGLSVCKDDALSSQVPGFRNGTKSHMAPEILSGSGSQSNASDIYSFGILLFELYTGIDAFLDMFHLNFDQMVVDHNLRPTFPPDAPAGYRDLAVACWSRDRSARPSFESVLASLVKLREEEGGQADHVNIEDLIVTTHNSSVQHHKDATSSKSVSNPVPCAEPPIQLQRVYTTDDKEFWEMFFNHG